MDEVQRRAVPEPGEIGTGAIRVDRRPQRREALEPEDGVVEVGEAGAVGEPAGRIVALAEEAADQISRRLQQRRRQPRDLQHFEPQTHCTSPSARCR